MDINAREWMQQYEMTKRKIVARRQSGQFVQQQELKGLLDAVRTLDSQLKTMSTSMMEYDIAASEVARRQTLIESLTRQMSYLAANSSAATGATVVNNPDTGSANPMLGTSDKGLVQRQQEVMKQQDAMLEDIGRGVNRLYVQAKNIGEETKTHIRLLDDLEGHVDDTTVALTSEAKHAESVREKSQACWMYICVAIEVVILILLLMIAFV